MISRHTLFLRVPAVSVLEGARQATLVCEQQVNYLLKEHDFGPLRPRDAWRACAPELTDDAGFVKIVVVRGGLDG